MNRLLRYIFLRKSSTTIPLVNVVKLDGRTMHPREGSENFPLGADDAMKLYDIIG